MVNWTRAVAVFTAFLALLAGFQAWIIWGQLGEMKAAREGGDRSMADQMDVMRTQAKAMQGQFDLMNQQMQDARQTQRAFITVSDVTITKSEREGPNISCWRIQPIITNDGGTPTDRMQYLQQIVVSTYPPVGKEMSAYRLILAPSDPGVYFKKYGGWSAALLGPKRTLPSTHGDDVACLDENASGDFFASKRIYARGVIHYRDVYANSIDHITKYCFWVQADRNVKGFKPSSVLCRNWNCADDGCTKDEESYTANIASAFSYAHQTLVPPKEDISH